MSTDTATHRARGILVEKSTDGIVFEIPQTDYRLHLNTLNEVPTEPGDRIVGVIRAHAAKSLDIVGTGGRYIDPLMGQPRRIQGTITEIDAGNNTITVDAATPIVLTLAKPQKASDFKIGQLVAGGVKSGASFSIAGS